MNLNRTLDSIIYRYARRSARTTPGPPAQVDPLQSPANEDLLTTPQSAVAAQAAEEPLEDEEIQAVVSHIGSCNTAVGCWASTRIRVRPHTSYFVAVSAAQIDMSSESEKLASVSVGGRNLGECNPMPDDDYNCSLTDCFQQERVSPEATASGTLLLEVHSVRTHSDCRCNQLHVSCYSAAVAAFTEVTEEEKTTDPSYGMFVRFVLTPEPSMSSKVSKQASQLQGTLEWQNCTDEWKATSTQVGHPLRWYPAWQSAERFPAGCSCISEQSSSSSCPASHVLQWDLFEAKIRRPRGNVAVRRIAAECDGPDVLLGISVSLAVCVDLCQRTEGCTFVSYGIGHKRGHCFWEIGSCTSFEPDTYIVYDVEGSSEASNNRSGLFEPHDCTLACTMAGTHIPDADPPAAAAAQLAPSSAGDDLLPEDEEVDLLITEEGWGLSSANWLIRRSNWSISFLEQAFELCHKQMPLFGDQDAIIQLLFNGNALQHGFWGDPMDRHAVVVPQREFNAYDALNAHYMGCDGYHDGDLLVTFPGCKDPDACNPLFELAAEHTSVLTQGTQDGGSSDPTPNAAYLRLFGPPELAGAVYEASRLRKG